MAVTFADERHYLDYEGLNQFMDKLNKNFRTRFKYKGELYIASETRTGWDDLIPAAVGNLYVLKADELVPDPDHPGEFLPPSPTRITIDGVDYEVGDTIYVTNRVQEAPDPTDPDAVHVTVNKISGNGKALVLCEELPELDKAKPYIGYVLEKFWHDEENNVFYEKGTYTLKEEVDPVTGVKELSWVIAGMPRKNAYAEISKLEDYLYYLKYCGTDFDYTKYLDDVVDYGACSAAKLDAKTFVRNFDFMLNETSQFVVNVDDKVLGVCGGIMPLTQEFVDSGDFSPLYEILPYRMLDGINTSGLAAAVLMSPFEDGDTPTTGTNPSSTISLNAAGAVRYILDNASTVQQAKQLWWNVNWHVSEATRETGHELMVMVTDMESSCLLFFNNNYANVTDLGFNPNDSYLAAKYPIAANFNPYLSHAITEYNPDVYVDEPALSLYFNWIDDPALENEKSTPWRDPWEYKPHSSGMERYNHLYHWYSDGVIPSISDMRRQVGYTAVYDANSGRDIDGKKYVNYSDLVGATSSGEELVINSTVNWGKFDAARTAAKTLWDARTRDNTFWQTVHTCYYDLENLSVKVYGQEEIHPWNAISEANGFEFNLPIGMSPFKTTTMIKEGKAGAVPKPVPSDTLKYLNATVGWDTTILNDVHIYNDFTTGFHETIDKITKELLPDVDSILVGDNPYLPVVSKQFVCYDIQPNIGYNQYKSGESLHINNKVVCLCTVDVSFVNTGDGKVHVDVTKEELFVSNNEFTNRSFISEYHPILKRSYSSYLMHTDKPAEATLTFWSHKSNYPDSWYDKTPWTCINSDVLDLTINDRDKHPVCYGPSPSDSDNPIFRSGNDIETLANAIKGYANKVKIKCNIAFQSVVYERTEYYDKIPEKYRLKRSPSSQIRFVDANGNEVQNLEVGQLITLGTSTSSTFKTKEIAEIESIVGEGHWPYAFKIIDYSTPFTGIAVMYDMVMGCYRFIPAENETLAQLTDNLKDWPEFTYYVTFNPNTMEILDSGLNDAMADIEVPNPRYMAASCFTQDHEFIKVRYPFVSGSWNGHSKAGIYWFNKKTKMWERYYLHTVPMINGTYVDSNFTPRNTIFKRVTASWYREQLKNATLDPNYIYVILDTIS